MILQIWQIENVINNVLDYLTEIFFSDDILDLTEGGLDLKGFKSFLAKDKVV